MIKTDKRKAVFLLHQGNMAVREIARHLALGRNTVGAIIRQKGVRPPHARTDKQRLDEELLRRLYQQCEGRIVGVHEKLEEEEGVQLAYSTLTRMLRVLGISQPQRPRRDRAAEQRRHWMQSVLRGAKTSSQIKEEEGDALTADEIRTLLKCVRTKPLKARNRALILLAYGYGITPGHIASFLLMGRKTARRYISDFKKGGIQCVLHRTRKGVRKAAEKFFSIDEYGPFSVKLMGGRALTKPGEIRTIPERQKSKGSLIATAALELSTNPLTVRSTEHRSLN